MSLLAYLRHRLRHQLQQRADAGDGEQEHREAAPEAEQVDRHHDQRRPHAGAPDAFEEFADEAAPAALGLLQPAAFLVHEGGAHHLENLVVGEEVHHAEGGEPHQRQVEEAQRVEVAVAIRVDQRDRDGGKRHEDDEGDRIPEVLFARHPVKVTAHGR